MLKRQSHAILYRIARFDSQTLMSAYTDPLFVRSLHTRSIGNRLDADIVNRINPIEIYSNSTGANGLFKVIKGGNPNGLTLTSCFDSHKKAQALAQHRRLLRGLGSGPREERGAGTTDLADGRGSFLRSNTTRFQGNDKIAVAVDIDEVLGNFVSALNRFIADRYLSNHSVSEYHVYEFFRIWNCSRNEADIRVHEFFKTTYFKKGIHPLPEILIDDNPRYAEECANIGMTVLLFDYENSYPWSKSESVDRHPLVTRVHNWEEVEQHILSWVVSKC